jgi:carbonic anhydrase
MSAINDFPEANYSYAEIVTKGDKPMPPAKKVAVVACMDARIETGRLNEVTNQ